MSSTALFEDGQASLSPSSLTQEQDNSTHSDSSANDNDFVDTQSDSSDDDLEVVLALPNQDLAVQQPNTPATVAAVPGAPSVVNVPAPVAAVPGAHCTVNVRYTQPPLVPMVLDNSSTHLSPWYAVVAGKFIGVFEDTGSADRATRKVSCSSHKVFTSQQAAVNAFNASLMLGDLEVIT